MAGWEWHRKDITDSWCERRERRKGWIPAWILSPSQIAAIPRKGLYTHTHTQTQTGVFQTKLPKSWVPGAEPAQQTVQ